MESLGFLCVGAIKSTTTRQTRILSGGTSTNATRSTVECALGIGLSKKKSRRRCVCDDTCKMKCESRREHDLRHPYKFTSGFIPNPINSPKRKVLNTELGRAIKALLEG